MIRNTMILENEANAVLNGVPENTTLYIKNVGNVDIDGPVGRYAQIYREGQGTLNINGSVDYKVRFYIKGTGFVCFKERPPYNVLSNLQLSGRVFIDVPGGYEASSQYCESLSQDVLIRNLTMANGRIHYTDVNGKPVTTRNGADFSFADGHSYLDDYRRRNPEASVSSPSQGGLFSPVGNTVQANKDKQETSGSWPRVSTVIMRGV